MGFVHEYGLLKITSLSKKKNSPPLHHPNSSPPGQRVPRPKPLYRDWSNGARRAAPRPGEHAWRRGHHSPTPITHSATHQPLLLPEALGCWVVTRVLGVLTGCGDCLGGLQGAIGSGTHIHTRTHTYTHAHAYTHTLVCNPAKNMLPLTMWFPPLIPKMCLAGAQRGLYMRWGWGEGGT